MQQMVELLQKQQYEINDLRGALRQQGHQQESLEIMRAQLQNLEGNLASRVEGALSSYTQGESILSIKSNFALFSQGPKIKS